MGFPKILCMLLALELFAGLPLLPEPAAAQEENARLNKWDGFVFGEWLGSDSVVEPRDKDIRYEEAEGIALGAGFGRTVHDMVNVGGELYYAGTDLQADVKGLTGEPSTDLRLIGVGMFLDLFLSDWKVVPLLTGGMGFVHSDWEFGPTSAADLGLQTVSKSEGSRVNFYFRLGAGLRWDFYEKYFAKVIYQRTWRNIGENINQATIPGYKFAFGMKF
ncbi:MAG: hypothetical protein JRI97_06620 [Deltaproteobacteria bacterium]|nr:hypothetical protein [Deltaproteobacteria bacterium]